MNRRAILISVFTTTLTLSALVSAQSTEYVDSPFKYTTIADFVAQALRVMVMVALPIISLFIVYAGFMFVIARGNEGKLSEAKSNFYYVIVGAILILGAWVFATLIGGTISQLTK